MPECHRLWFPGIAAVHLTRQFFALFRPLFFAFSRAEANTTPASTNVEMAHAIQDAVSERFLDMIGPQRRYRYHACHDCW